MENQDREILRNILMGSLVINLLLLCFKSLLLCFCGQLSGCLEVETVSVGVSGLQSNGPL